MYFKSFHHAMATCTANHKVHVALAREGTDKIPPNTTIYTAKPLERTVYWTSNAFAQSVNRHLLNQTLLSVFSVAGTTSKERAPMTMSDEENAIRYASGCFHEAIETLQDREGYKS